MYSSIILLRNFLFTGTDIRYEPLIVQHDPWVVASSAAPSQPDFSGWHIDGHRDPDCLLRLDNYLRARKGK